MKTERLQFNTTPTLEEFDGKPTRLIGVAIPFYSADDPGTETQRYGEFHRFVPGAFSKALKRGDDVLALVNHNGEQIIGRTSNGTLELKETERGLEYAVALPDTTLARDLAALVKRGDIRGNSAGVLIHPQGTRVRKNGERRIREIVSVAQIHDVGPTPSPAFVSTSVSAFSRDRAEVTPFDVDFRLRLLEVD